MKSLSSEEIEERIEICSSVDLQACTRCGKPLPPQAALDPEWVIESQQTEDGSAVAEIHCPDCRDVVFHIHRPKYTGGDNYCGAPRTQWDVLSSWKDAQRYVCRGFKLCEKCRELRRDHLSTAQRRKET